MGCSMLFSFYLYRDINALRYDPTRQDHAVFEKKPKAVEKERYYYSLVTAVMFLSLEGWLSKSDGDFFFFWYYADSSVIFLTSP